MAYRRIKSRTTGNFTPMCWPCSRTRNATPLCSRSDNSRPATWDVWPSSSLAMIRLRRHRLRRANSVRGWQTVHYLRVCNGTTAATSTPFSICIFPYAIVEGQGDLSVDIEHPLARPIREPATKGAPGSPWQFVGIRHPDNSAPTLIGALVSSLTGRLVFFPSGDFNFTDTPNLGRFSGQPIDHFTLDPPKFGKWSSHTTLKDGTRRERHGMRNTATQLSGEMFLWHSIFSPDLNGFFSMPRTLTIPLKRAASDMSRYTQESIGTNYRSRALIDAPPAKVNESFWQIDFFCR